MLLCEILPLKAQPTFKESLLEGFARFDKASRTAAAVDHSEGALATHGYTHVRNEDDVAWLFIFWRSHAHHDELSKNINFEPASKILKEHVLPKLLNPPAPFHLQVQDTQSLQAPQLEYIELTIKFSITPAEALRSVSQLLSNLEGEVGFLGSEYALKEEDERSLCIFLKWRLEVDHGLNQVSESTIEVLQNLGDMSHHVHLSGAFQY